MGLEDTQQHEHEPVTQPKEPAPTVVRKKFAKPPVKVACLACRASRTRCDGKETCSSCASKGRKCSYLPSKRGGPRKKKSTVPPSSTTVQQDASWNPVPIPVSRFDESAGMFNQIDPLALPGAGLRHLDFPTEVQSMFEDLFAPGDGANPHVQMEPAPAVPPKPSMVRAYGSEPDILNAYYDFIHAYFPILPPRAALPYADRPLNGLGSSANALSEELSLLYQPSSPLSLAISAILALVPHPDDPEPTSANSVLLRRSYAQKFAGLAITCIEADQELIDSSTDPSQALSNETPIINRAPFHPKTPVELEGILALLVLCTYEYAQRGNLSKMKYRAGQALTLAMNMSLHSLGEEYDEFAEARRRAWWMTYYCVLQSSISGIAPPTITIDDPRFVTPYPSFPSDPEGWSILMQAQQVLVSATQFTLDLNRCLRSRSNMKYICDRMQQLDAWASSVMARANTPPSGPRSSLYEDPSEALTAHSIRAISRIKISSAHLKTHRFRAFSDIPIFIKKHCDLAAAKSDPAQTDKTYNLNRRPSGISRLSCSCSSMEPVPRPQAREYAPSPSDSSSSSGSVSLGSQYSFLETGFPFTSQHSAKVCLRAALIIARMFQSLPFPRPLYSAEKQNGSAVPSASQEYVDPASLDPRTQLPRTMPSFACCAMQSSYAMLMLFYKTRVAKQLSPDSEGGNNSSSERLVEELRSGLERIIGAMKNYSRAFEALDGMRDEIEGAFQTAFPQQ
ncbi:C6 zinc finger domain protein [Paecilomyces variotii]|uniref:C6 zinc finger domain protein n=1 Tax=Byssochlamys spectabilis TaxID=264951 RepID=A0A443I6X6_BYSSP|nr:C6 zinc finger domain protein [Paecilomyces variotii]KAJ9356121.1 transcriptional regulator family: Fungal Specific TF [Paecilomyces variotii]RWQ99859.1 C6 zinc finger domain protein [Paecilomyces variotii]